jgi:SAM-dependent methyltransferase
MEGLIPVLMARRGASEVTATDVYLHAIRKIAAIKHYYNVEFDFLVTPPRLGICDSLAQIKRTDFDLVNASGLLYHVLSPMHYLFEIRALLRTGGIAIISTYVLTANDFAVHFNISGHFQSDISTYWYITAGLFDYMLRFTRLAPVDCFRVGSGKDWQAYTAVICRAIEDVLPTRDDDWMKQSAAHWESEWNSRKEMIRPQTAPDVVYSGAFAREYLRDDTGTVDLLKAVTLMPPVSCIGETKHMCSS